MTPTITNPIVPLNPWDGLYIAHVHDLTKDEPGVLANTSTMLLGRYAGETAWMVTNNLLPDSPLAEIAR